MKKNSKTLPMCGVCGKGSCCRYGVEVDLFEVAVILKKNPSLPKPWFEYLGRDKNLPSGFKFTTVLRNRRCVFQDARGLCSVYEVRPRYCIEFPLEGGKRAPFYHDLCHLAKEKKLKKKLKGNKE